MAEKVGAVLVVGGGIAGIRSALDLADSGFRVHLVESNNDIGGQLAQLTCLSCKVCHSSFPQEIDCEKMVCGLALVDEIFQKVRWNDNIELLTGSHVNTAVKQDDNFIISITKQVILDGENHLPCGLSDKAIKPDVKTETIERTVGSVILAPGHTSFDPSILSNYGYGKFMNVLTSSDFEKIIHEAGPTGGIVIRPSDNEIPEKVAFLQCIGSRDETNEYCSSICCMFGLKDAVLAQDSEGLKSHIFFMDFRTVGKEFDDYYVKAQQEHGIEFNRCRVPDVEEDPKTNNLILKYVEDGKIKEEIFNMVVLSTGLQPPASAKDISEIFGVELNEYGFCSTELFSPIATSVPGIFVAGTFSAPKDIPMSMADASGAAGKASGILASQRNTSLPEMTYPPEKMVAGARPRIGVFICECGANISSVVNVSGLEEYAKNMPHVVHVECNQYTCSSDTRKKIVDMIKEHDLNRVIVAAGTPRTHELLFQNTIREGGLNPNLLEIVNIRSQCSQVHAEEPKKATEKAKELIRMAAAKSRIMEPLTRESIDIIPRGLVIGGGISGMTAALDLASQGFESYLVERGNELGGTLQRTHYLLGHEDPQALLKSTVEKINDNDKIHVFTNAEIKESQGSVGDFKTIISTTNGEEEFQHGTVIVATGAKEYEPTEYLYGKNPLVLTQSELEQNLSKDNFSAKHVVMIQCVGSRTQEQPYCSRTCCGDAIKNALKIKESNPRTEIYVLYKDMRTYGFNEKYYKEAADKGVVFIRYDDDNMPLVEDNNGVQVSFTDMILDRKIILKPDMLVLSTGMLPHDGTENLAQLFNLSIGKDGYFIESHIKFLPFEFSTAGAFLCGKAHNPKYIDECISQASAAAARAGIILSKEILESEAVVSEVNDTLCIGCGICVEVCPYSAIELDGGKAQVNALLCKGCGLCTATCRSGAIQQKGFNDHQIISMIKSSMYEVI